MELRLGARRGAVLEDGAWHSRARVGSQGASERDDSLLASSLTRRSSAGADLSTRLIRVISILRPMIKVQGSTLSQIRSKGVGAYGKALHELS